MATTEDTPSTSESGEKDAIFDEFYTEVHRRQNGFEGVRFFYQNSDILGI